MAAFVEEEAQPLPRANSLLAYSAPQARTIVHAGSTLSQWSSELSRSITSLLSSPACVLVSLSIISHRMDVAAVTSLAQALTHNTTLRSLSLSGNEIGDRGAQAIAAMLATNRTLTRLDLSKAKIGNIGCKAIAQHLAGSSVLHLNLAHNSIKADGGKAIALAAADAASPLRSLSLAFNAIGSRGFKDSTAPAIARSTSLKFLNLSDCSIDGPGAAALAEGLAANTALEHLYLKSGKLLEAGTAFGALLTANTTLKSLHMSSTSFDDESLMPIITALHHNTTLANLSLREEAQAIFRPIRPTVRHLLPGQVASPAPPIECFTQAASELAAVVRSTRSLTKLHITRLSEDGAREVARAIADNASIRELHMRPLSPITVQRLKESLENNYHLFRVCTPQTRGRFGASKRMVNLCEFQEMVSYSELQQMLASGKRLHQCPWLPQTHELFGQRFQHTVRELWTLHGTYENEAFSLLPPELMFHLCELLCTLSLAPPATANAAATTSTSTSTSTAS